IAVGRSDADIDTLAPGGFWQFQKRWVSRQWNHDGGVRAGEILDSQQQATHDITDPENLLRVWTPAVALGVELRDRSAEIYSARCWAVAKAFALGVIEQHLFDNRRGRKIAFGNKKWQDIGLKLSPLTGKTGAQFILSRKLHVFYPSPLKPHLRLWIYSQLRIHEIRHTFSNASDRLSLYNNTLIDYVRLYTQLVI